MTPTPSATIVCPACSQSYRWRPSLAGRRVRCKCGQSIVVEAEAPPDEPYDLAAETPPTLHQASAQTVPPARPVGLAYQRSADARREPHDTEIPEKTRDLYAPLALLAAGVAVATVLELIQAPTPRIALISLTASLVLTTGLMLVALFIAAHFRGIQFGPFGTAVLKLASASVASDAAMGLLMLPLGFIPGGELMAFVGGFALYFALLGFFFDLDQSDTWYLVMVGFVLKVAAYFTILALIA